MRSLWESVRWRNEWDWTPSSSVAPVDGLLTQMGQGLEADSQIITATGYKYCKQYESNLESNIIRKTGIRKHLMDDKPFIFITKFEFF